MRECKHNEWLKIQVQLTLYVIFICDGVSRGGILIGIPNDEGRAHVTKYNPPPKHNKIIQKNKCICTRGRLEKNGLV